VSDLLSPDWVVDLALAAVAIEIVALVGWRLYRKRGLRIPDVIGQLAAGGLLLLAVRCEIAGADPRWTLALLAASLPAHAFDLYRRVRNADEA